MSAPEAAAGQAAGKLPGELRYVQYEHRLEHEYLPAIRALISKDLSEPYSIYVYRYFLCQWAKLCFMALHPTDSTLLGVIICKLEQHHSHSPPTRRGYIAMLAVASPYRGHGIATELVRRAIDTMIQQRADEVVLETEEDNAPAMRLYQRLGFLRAKKLHRYYLNGSSAYRLVLLLRSAANYPHDGASQDVDALRNRTRRLSGESFDSAEFDALDEEIARETAAQHALPEDGIDHIS